jgi:nicotinamidase-related amidase
METKSALLILDMLNTFDFAEGKILAKRTLSIAKNILKLKIKCDKAKVPVIYVNDNFGDWHSDWKIVYEKCTAENCLGKNIGEMLKPTEKDLFVLKPKHSGFYSTNLEPLLKSLKVKRLILSGIAGDICVLFTAHDAHMRDFEIYIPKDCIISNTPQGDRFLMHQFEKTLKFPVGLSKNISL